MKVKPTPQPTITVTASRIGVTGDAQPPGLPEFHDTQTEALKGDDVTGKPSMRITQHFLVSANPMDAKNSATTRTDCAWDMD
jgi:hypothetical protein